MTSECSNNNGNGFNACLFWKEVGVMVSGAAFSNISDTLSNGVSKTNSVSASTFESSQETTEIGSQGKIAKAAIGGNPKSDEDILKIGKAQKEKYGSKDNSFYVGDSRKLNYTTVGGKGFDKKVSRYLRKISTSPDGRKMLQNLAAEDQALNIVEFASNFAGKDGLGTTILFNADSLVGNGRIIFQTSKGVDVGSSALPLYTLVHELFHAGQHTGAAFFQPNPPLWGDPSKSSFEAKAIRYTNQIRLQHGQTRVRRSHSAFIPGGGQPPL